MRVVVRGKHPESWCPTCGWSQGGAPCRVSIGESPTRTQHTPDHWLLLGNVTCPHPMGALGWCPYCGAVKDETETRGYAGPVWELPVDAQRRTNLRALTAEPGAWFIGPDKASVAHAADEQRKRFVAVRPMLPPIGESAPVCHECKLQSADHRCTFFAPSEKSILCGRWLCEAHAHKAFKGGAVLCAEHLPMAKELLRLRAEPKP